MLTLLSASVRIKSVYVRVLLGLAIGFLPTTSHRLSGIASHRAGIGLRPLTARWQTLGMPRTAIATDIPQTTDIRLHFMSQFTLDMILLLDFLAETIGILLGEILRTDIRIDIQFRENFLTEWKSDPIEIRERRFNSFIVREVHT